MFLAATTLQAHRSAETEDEKLLRAVVKIQAVWRGKRLRKNVKVSAPPRSRVDVLRRMCYTTLETKPKTKTGIVINLVLISLVLVSVLFFCLETMPSLRKTVNYRTWNVFEMLFSVFFMLEYLTRVWCCIEGGMTRGGYVRRVLPLFDFLACLPWFLEQLVFRNEAVGGLRVLRIVRLVRLSRIVRLSRYSRGMRLTAAALTASASILSVLGFVFVVAVVLASSCLYYAEKMSCVDTSSLSPQAAEQHEMECQIIFNDRVSSFGLCCEVNIVGELTPADFPSIPATFWWSVVTMTTVGFGDTYPRSLGGKLIAAVSLMTGILLVALPVAIVGRRFQQIYEQSETEHAVDTIVAEQQETIDKAKRTTMNVLKRFQNKNTTAQGVPTLVGTTYIPSGSLAPSPEQAAPNAGSSRGADPREGYQAGQAPTVTEELVESPREAEAAAERKRMVEALKSRSEELKSACLNGKFRSAQETYVAAGLVADRLVDAENLVRMRKRASDLSQYVATDLRRVLK